MSTNRSVADRFHGLAAAFYPEHLPEASWPAHVRAIADSGLQAVRIGEFWWDRLEPEEGRYDLAFVRRVLDLLAANGIRAILCTPTAAPPAWLCETYPEILPVDQGGRRQGFGGRRHTCPSSPLFRALARKVAGALGKAFAEHPAILAWQIDNELGHPFCYCDVCRDAFHAWLAGRHASPAELSERFGLGFWAQAVGRFDQVPLPRARFNPAIGLAWRRFVSDQWVDYCRTQREALLAAGARQPITTNMMAPWHGYDHVAMGRQMDVVGYDYYPLRHPFGFSFATMAFFAAMHRGYGEHEGFWLFETQVGSDRDALVLPGMVRCWTLAHIALGATLVEYFRWDMTGSGPERLNYGIVHGDGQPYRAQAEIARTAAELATLRPLLERTTREPAKVGILLSFPSWWDEIEHPAMVPAAYGAPAGMRGDIAHVYHHFCHFRSLAELGQLADVTHPQGDWSSYTLLVVPSLTVVDTALAEKLTAFVADGGSLLAVGMPGAVDEYGRAAAQPPPGPLAALLGVRLVDWGMRPEELRELRFAPEDDAGELPELAVGRWIELAEPQPMTEVIARYSAPALRPWPVLTCRQHGKGRAYYLATIPPDTASRRLYDWLLPQVGIAVCEPCEAGVCSVVRPGRDGAPDLRFLLNLQGDAAICELTGRWRDALSGEPVASRLPLGPYDGRVLVATER